MCHLSFVMPRGLTGGAGCISNPLFEWMSAFHSNCLELSIDVATTRRMTYYGQKLTVIDKRNSLRNFFSSDWHHMASVYKKAGASGVISHFGRRD
jgi:hypothetical protein